MNKTFPSFRLSSITVLVQRIIHGVYKQFQTKTDQDQLFHGFIFILTAAINKLRQLRRSGAALCAVRSGFPARKRLTCSRQQHQQEPCAQPESPANPRHAESRWLLPTRPLKWGYDARGGGDGGGGVHSRGPAEGQRTCRESRAPAKQCRVRVPSNEYL